jgi:hypothetical protein
MADHRPIESPEPTPKPMTKTILIVEDNELNMKLFHDLSTHTATRRSRRETAGRHSSSPASIAQT